MSKEFEIAREFEVDATPEEVWEAVTAGTGGWLWPMEAPEPRVGGKGPFGSEVIAWEPPHRYTNRVEDVEGISEQTRNQLDYTIEPRDDGRRAWVRYVHSGIFVDDWDNQYDGAAKHTGFYLHTLRQYLTRFAGRTVTAFTTFDGPETAGTPDALTTVGRALGLTDDTPEGARVQAEGPDGQLLDAVVDYRDPYFIGLRTDDALIRFFGRNHWGHRVGMSVHDFAPGADAKADETAWQGWLNGVFSQP
ncbi:SRPBCC domain-containing protein [Streptomyces europaeiscabiei]|uniref:SRPBCC domain-containing protein n=1 Tax=Streptomyces europaeiscabiei TaxID=146819 RepID=A0AAJ2UL21_9ACTN|nr:MULTISPECIES: SRPBCC domain-containing protein [Streptomyces]KFG01419.1 ATPase [Streptomyces scabiei]MDX3130529.1 SRPBCC domain-containing protein [Streptomyces europaeiscabiei]